MAIVAKQRVQFTWTPPAGMAAGDYYLLHGDNRTGTVNYAVAMDAAKIECFPNGETKAGFGQGLFGGGLFGVGALGITFVSSCLLDGTWKLAIVAYDEAGNPSTGNEEDTVVIAGTPAPPTGIVATLYTALTDTLALRMTLSVDDGN